ncbi:hypothetical protein [Pseudonocardia sp.]|uniref:hypothetical protein n=1 Tax=Pseudonocardia sp. TaxID=60912 RepID=UPI0026222BCB|nr:hypothetical protein [Pseudonocardia sp.]
MVDPFGDSLDVLEGLPAEAVVPAEGDDLVGHLVRGLRVRAVVDELRRVNIADSWS